MFDTPYSQIGAAIAIAVIAFALLKGDEPERVGAGAYALAMLASLLIQGDGAVRGTQWALMSVDIILLVVFAGLAWKARMAWPVWAGGLQSLIVMSHILTLVDIRPSMAAFYAVINLASLGVLASLAVGAFQAWGDRRAAGLE